jgi:hypothetical protein
MYLYLALLPWFGSLVADGASVAFGTGTSCREY